MNSDNNTSLQRPILKGTFHYSKDILMFIGDTADQVPINVRPVANTRRRRTRRQSSH